MARSTATTARRIAMLLATLVLLALAAAPAEARQRNARRAACAHAQLVPTAQNLSTVRAALLCLHNRERARHGLRRLRGDARLRRAAEGHSARMVRDSFFDHDGPGGSSFVDRILAAGYGDFSTAGENIAWGGGPLASAAAMQRAWMASPGHRANILRPDFREIGLGIALGVPVGGGPGATYTADFATRR